MKTYRIILFIICLCPISVFAQGINKAILNALKGLRKDKMSYEYNMTLVNGKTNEQLDALNGRIYKLNDFYLDSNAVYISVRDEDYALQINNQKKAAYLKSVAQIEKKIGKKLPARSNVLYDLDKLLLKSIRSSKEYMNAAGDSVFQVSFNSTDVRALEAVISKNNKLVSMTVKLLGESDGSSEMLRIMVMRNFKDDFKDGMVSTRRFLGADAKHSFLKGRYAGYHLKRILY